MNLLLFYKRVINRINVYKNRLWKYVDASQVSMRGFRAFADTQAFIGRLRTMLGTYDDSLFEGVGETERRVILDAANATLRHEFDLLGSGPVNLAPIDWHIDFKAGARWNKSFYREIGRIPGADIKVPWELSRCQHFLWLGEAFLLTQDDRYAKEIVDELSWWIDDNPFMYSVNWNCSMEVAFRAVNWMYAINMIAGYSGIDEEFFHKVALSLWQHGVFIRNNLERQIPFSNNHYASDIVGLLYIGKFFSHTCKGLRWLAFARKEFNREVLIQVLDSGVHYERSVSYHRLMTELLSYPVYMLKRTGDVVPQCVVERIERMYAYVAEYTKPNGLAPLIADNDDGRFVPFMKRDFRRHGYMNQQDSIENRFVALGCPSLFCTSSDGNHFYPDAGVAIIKQSKLYLYINHGGYGKHPKDTDVLIGTHTHNDLLSFELNLDGEDILVDAGTFLYTSSKEERDSFRSTFKHNTIMVDGEEQNVMSNTFVLKRNVHKGELKQMSERVFEGEYCTIEGKMNHKRSFDFRGGQLIIKDTISKVGTSHDAKFYFHFAPGLAPIILDDEIVVKGKARMSFNKKAAQMEMVDDTISPSFGVLEKSTTSIITFVFDERLELITTVNSII